MLDRANGKEKEQQRRNEEALRVATNWLKSPEHSHQLSRKGLIVSTSVVIDWCIERLWLNSRYSKVPVEFVVSECVSASDKEWICKTCNNTLKRGKLPAQAKVNNLDLDDVPPELSVLNPLEVHLISLRIPFMKMMALSLVTRLSYFRSAAK